MLNIVVYLVSQWETFHRRPMLEALAKNGEGKLRLLCINPVVSPSLRPNYWLSAARAWSKARAGPIQVSSNLHVFTSTCWFPSRIVHTGKRRILYNSIVGRQIFKILMKLGMTDGKRVAWVFRPEQLSMLGAAQEDKVVYECYDEYQLDPKTGNFIPEIKKEINLLKRADIVFTTSQSLYERRRQWHPRVHLVPNGADVEFWGRAMSEDINIAPELSGISRPLIGYPGHISSFIDIRLLKYLAEVRPNWSIVLLGEVTDNISLQGLRRKHNVYLLGKQLYHRLPNFAKGFDVSILPLIINEYLHCSNPLTLWEQLAAGNVVVSTDIREIRKYKDIVMVAKNKHEFVSHIDQALYNNNEDRIKQGIALAKEKSWNTITRKAVDILVKEFI